MLLLVRDEDVDAVSSVITTIALQHGLEPADPSEQGQDILSFAISLLGPRVVLAQGEDLVLVDGLASLELGDAERWGKAISEACSNEVVAVAPSPNGIVVTIFEDGELDESIAIDLDPSGITRSSALAELAPTDEAAEELRAGIPAFNAIELAKAVLRSFGAGEETLRDEPATLSFRAPDDDDTP